jgi:putative ABC transport system permease protein
VGLTGAGTAARAAGPADPGGAPRPSAPGSPFGPGTGAALLDPQAVLVAPALAAAESLRPGDVLRGQVDGRPESLRVAGLLPEVPGRPAPQRNLLVMDLPAAQRLFRRPGQLDRLDLGWLPERPGDPALLRARAAALLPPGWSLEEPEQRAASGRAMSAAFRLNLAVLSLVALVVGAYLLFQAFDAAVNRRRETWGLLRALGCPPGRILALVLGEAALLGGAGSLLGIGLGWALAQGAVRAVARTMTVL